MSCTITVDNNLIQKDTGEETAETKRYEIPFDYDESFWAVLKRRKHYEIFLTSICNLWYTNMLGIKLWTGDSILYDEIKDKLFKYSDKNSAIELCERLNRYQKIKIHQ